MKEFDILQSIENMAKEQKLDSSLFQPTEQIPYENLIIFLGADSHERPYVLNITAQNQVLDPKKASDIYRIQFLVKLPFKVAELSISQTSNLIALLNRFADLPGFELSEVDNELFFRHVLLINKKGMSKELILGLIGMIKFILDLNAGSIEAVASGKLTYDELLTQALKVTA